MANTTLNKEKLKKLQQIELDAMTEIDRICRKHNIKYTLTYGTLIGAVRHNGFIPWDDDIDIFMMRDDCEKFKKLCETELNDRFFYQSHDTDAEYFHLFDKLRVNETVFKEAYLAKYNIHHGVYIDIFPLDYLPESNFKRKIQYIRYYFFRTGLMSKYMNVDNRHGLKKIMAKLLRFFYFPFSLEFLYNHAKKLSMKYNDKPREYCHNYCSSYKNKNNMKTESILNPVEIAYEDKSFYIMRDYDLYLTKEYGDYMKLPPENERTVAHELVDLSI